jgi:hypothetical protein
MIAAAYYRLKPYQSILAIIVPSVKSASQVGGAPSFARHVLFAQCSTNATFIIPLVYILKFKGHVTKSINYKIVYNSL